MREHEPAAEVRINTATNFITGQRGVTVHIGEAIGILSPQAARGVAASLIELADEIDPPKAAK